jgi:NAD-dependent deacetylase
MQKQHLVVLSGAGISAESGLKTFRDGDGLWNGYDVYEVASPHGWKRDAALVLDFYNMRRKDVLAAEPNTAHTALVQLEKDFDVTIITQNIDDLHERAGSSNVLHLHGEIFKMRATNDENTIYDIRGDIQLGDTNKYGVQLRPHIVWFDEPVPMIEKAVAITSSAGIFVVIGTSLQVYPAASLLHYVPSDVPKYIIDKNIAATNKYPGIHFIEKPATEGMKELLKILL